MTINPGSNSEISIENHEGEFKNDFSCPNTNCFINRFCSSEWKNLLYHKKKVLHFKKNDFIIREGEKVLGIYFIYEGKTKLQMSGDDENDVIFRLAKEGELLGHRSFELNNYPFSAIALEDTTICFIEKEPFIMALKNNVHLTYNLLLFYLDELRKAELKLHLMNNNKSTTRIAEVLLYINEVFGQDEKICILNTNLSRSDIANMSGTSYETVIRTLKQFVKWDLISVENNKLIILNKEGLKELNKFS